MVTVPASPGPASQPSPEVGTGPGSATTVADPVDDVSPDSGPVAPAPSSSSTEAPAGSGAQPPLLVAITEPAIESEVLGLSITKELPFTGDALPISTLAGFITGLFGLLSGLALRRIGR